MDELLQKAWKLIPAITSRSFAGLLFLLIATGWTPGQRPGDLGSIRSAVNNGQFEQVVTKATAEIARSRNTGSFVNASEAGVLYARSLIHLERYEEASKVLDDALSDAEKSKNANAIARVFFVKAALSRFQRNFPDAILHARKGLASSPNDQQAKLEYHLAIGRILYSSGYDIAAIVWLEKAEKLSSSLPISSAHIDVLGHLSFTWAAKFSYAKAVEYAEKLVKTAERTEYRYRYRLALFEFGNLLSSIGQQRKAKALLEKGLDLSLKAKDDYESCLFLNTLILTSLYKGDIAMTEPLLLSLERLDRDGRFKFETTRNKAVLAGLKGQDRVSESYFKGLASLKGYSEHIVPYWKLTLAEHKKDWAGVIEQAELLRKISEEQNFREDLPGIYFSLAKGYRGQGRPDLAIEYARRSIGIVEGDRPVGDAPLSLSMVETYHSVYRLLAEMENTENDPLSGLAFADYSKARVLRDRIENSALRRRTDLGPEIRKRAEELSTRLIEGSDVGKELAELERSVTLSIPRHTAEPTPDHARIRNTAVPAGTAIVSYLFSLEGALSAYVAEQGKPVRIARLSLSETEAEKLAQTVRVNIRDKTFYKTDGKAIYDKLLAPLSVSADHIVIVPDKALWKIPFHALSPDGTSYLIQQKMVSYSASVSILLNELTRPAPARRSIQVFANDSFQDRYLAYVNPEAANIARVFSSRPLLNATRSHFMDLAGGADMLHLSMHAQADPEEPLNSFLAFKAQGRDSGRVTVEDLLTARLKKQSLVFLASCETNNVLDGEGLVSIAWALLGSGSASVVSAQWDANDRSTQLFTYEFYRNLRGGKSTAKALQSAAIALIENKAINAHEPYFWAAFSLIGDYR